MYIYTISEALLYICMCVCARACVYIYTILEASAVSDDIKNVTYDIYVYIYVYYMHYPVFIYIYIYMHYLGGTSVSAVSDDIKKRCSAYSILIILSANRMLDVMRKLYSPTT